MDLHLSGKRALITGGSKGIGRATAEVLAAEGMDVLLIARDPAALATAAAGIRARWQVQVDVLAADLSDEAEVQRVVAAAGVVDVLVNNAGAIPPGTVLQVDNETWRRAWDLKVFGFISLCRSLYPAMAARKSSSTCSVLQISPLRTPRERDWPRPMMFSAPSAFCSPTTTQIFEVPISRPAMMLESSNIFSPGF